MKENHSLPDDIELTVERALHEDIGSGDLTALLLPENIESTATVICKEDAVLCGKPWFDDVYRQLDSSFKISWSVSDGDKVEPGTTVCTLNGSARVMLTGERTALNFLQLLSATATTTHEYQKLISNTKTQLLDTRKTLPGLRTAQKYAVLCGCGKNHRMGLYDAILIKENHIGAAGSIAVAHERAKQFHHNIEIEVENLDELRQALNSGAKQILLDNFDLVMMKEAVSITSGQATLEVSGGVNKDTIKDIASTGVDYVSVGGLTKNIRAIDFSMRVVTN